MRDTTLGQLSDEVLDNLPCVIWLALDSTHEVLGYLRLVLRNHFDYHLLQRKVTYILGYQEVP